MLVKVDEKTYINNITIINNNKKKKNRNKKNKNKNRKKKQTKKKQQKKQKNIKNSFLCVTEQNFLKK